MLIHALKSLPGDVVDKKLTNNWLGQRSEHGNAKLQIVNNSNHGALGRLLEVSARTARIEDFGLRLAETRTLSILGPVGLLVGEEPTVRAALQSLLRYIPLHNESLYLRLQARDG